MKAHLRSLDGLRGLAILLVLIHHLIPFRATGSIAGKLVNGFAGMGWCGVSLFFVLSGFLITGILYDTREDSKFFRRFYGRRALRIFPLYYVMVMLCTVVFPHLRATAEARPAGHVWMYWVYLANYHYAFLPGESGRWLGLFWSLAVEEHFYFVWPLMIWAVSRVWAIRVSLACVVLAMGFRWWYIAHGNTLAPYVWTPCRMDDLALGAIVALAVRGRMSSERLWRVGVAGAFGFGALALGVTFWRHAVVWDPVVQMVGMPAFALCFASLLTTMVLGGETGRLARVFRGRVLVVFGRYSYGLYVLHTAVASLLAGRFLFHSRLERADDAGHALGVMIATLLLAQVSWFCFEGPILRLKRHLAYDEAARGAGVKVVSAA